MEAVVVNARVRQGLIECTAVLFLLMVSGLLHPHDSGNSYPSLSLKKVHGEVCECTAEVCDCTVEGMFHVVLTCNLNLFLCEIARSRPRTRQDAAVLYHS